MQAIILAAGMGKRLKQLTAENTKCMVEVNGTTLIERMLQQLDRLGLRRIVLVVGYKAEELKRFIGTLPIETPIEYVENPVYDQTNNIYSLHLASSKLCEDDTILLESDLIFEPEVLYELVNDPRPTLALVDKYESWMDGTVVKLNEDDEIVAFVPGSKFEFDEIPEYYKTVNIYKFSKDFSNNVYSPFLNAYCIALGNNEYYEQVLRVITMMDNSEIYAKRLDGQLWYEIDDLQDLDIASSMFAPTQRQKKEMIERRYGGFWRYPKLLDFCYLVNPYYPPKRLLDEIKANFEALFTEYPSGQAVNALLAAKYYGISQDKVAVGNGAAELINACLSSLSGNTGFIRPSFEEYPNRYPEGDSVVFIPDKEGFMYTSEDLTGFFSDKGIDNLVLVNPDNPTGNLIPFEDVLKLAHWCADRSITLVYDESFADFCDDGDCTFLRDELLDEHTNVISIKSISKSHGVPGARLGVAASSNQDLIGNVRRNSSIWNINSFGEFYFQIAEKYTRDFDKALDEFRKERMRFKSDLDTIEALNVFPSQANYFLAKILNGMSATELTERLLCEGSILIKDLSSKKGIADGQYVRIAIRSREDNEKLVKALNEVLG